MASSEGIAFRWEAFNRWCDEYADRHQGMKPKVEDVRKWHREHAEKVWPDNSERPSVFLAVSHNKGRRVRGHKTCEYYKKYRAGKAAEQQLAARLQPAALSGRRILAVTAAARKLNTDCARGVSKRSTPDDDAAQERELDSLEQSEKRRRIRPLSRPHLFSPVHAVGARSSAGRRSSSEEPSEDPSWASGAEASDDDSGSALAATPGFLARRSAAHAQPSTRSPPHTGVHITVVRRDAEGRTVQVQAQSPLQSNGMPAYAALQGLFTADNTAIGCMPSGSLRQPCRARGNSGGTARGRGGAVYEYDCEEEDGSNADADAEGADMESDQLPRRTHSRSDDSRHDTPQQEGSQELQQRPGSGAARYVEGEWEWGRQWHPGVAPQECRAARSSSTSQQPRLPHFTGYVETPIGSMPVYQVGSGGGDTPALVRRVREGQWTPGTRSRAAVTAAAAKDPLDLLAAACEALASPLPAHDEAAAKGQAKAVEQVAGIAGEGRGRGGCRSGASEGSTYGGNSGDDDGGGRRGGSRGGSGGAGALSPRICSGPCAGPDGLEEVAMKVELPAGSDVGQGCSDPAMGAGGAAPASEKVKTTAASAASECLSAATQDSDGAGATAAGTHDSKRARPQPAAAAAALASQVKCVPPSPHSSMALPPADTVGWGAACDVGANADDKPHLQERPAVIATAATSSVATAPSAGTAALPAPPVAAAAQSASDGTTSDGSGGRPLNTDVDTNMTCRAAASAAAADTDGAAVAAALLCGQPEHQSRLAPGAATGAGAVPVASVSWGASQGPAPLSWPTLTGAACAARAAAAPAFTPIASPLFGDASALGALAGGVHVTGHLLPMVRLLHMQMATQLDPLCGDAGGLPTPHSACTLPPAVDVGLVAGSTSPPHSMVVVPRSLQQSR